MSLEYVAMTWISGDLEVAKSVLEDFLAPNLANNSAAFAAQELQSHFVHNM